MGSANGFGTAGAATEAGLDVAATFDLSVAAAGACGACPNESVSIEGSPANASDLGVDEAAVAGEAASTAFGGAGVVAAMLF
jgi:hypothetical protein